MSSALTGATNADPVARVHWLHVFAYATLVAAAVLGSSFLIDPIYKDSIQSHRVLEDFWFDTDPWRIARIVGARDHGGFDASARHPLYNPIAFFPSRFVMLLGFEIPDALRILAVSFSIVWSASWFVYLQVSGLTLLESWVFALLGASTSAAMFHLSIPETHVLASTAYLLGLIYLTLPNGYHSIHNCFALGVVTLGTTVTNWMMGIAAAFRTLPLRQAAGVVCATLLATYIYALGAKIVFPSQSFPFFSPDAVSWVEPLGAGGPTARLYSMWISTAVAPPLELVSDGRGDYFLTFQHSQVQTTIGYACAALWLVLLGLGFAGLFSKTTPPILRDVLLLTLAGEMLLRLIFGTETFLYSVIFLPLLLCVAVSGLQTRFRHWVLALALVLTPLLFLNNASVFIDTISFMRPPVLE